MQEGAKRSSKPPPRLGVEQERGYWEENLPRELSMGDPSSRQLNPQPSPQPSPPPLQVNRSTNSTAYMYQQLPASRSWDTDEVSALMLDLTKAPRSNLICFRCGETGHVRFQCLTFRVRLCQHHATDTCNERNCTYAHGVEQLRTPWKARCVRVIKQGGQLVCIGCNSGDHTFRKCPLHQDMILL